MEYEWTKPQDSLPPFDEWVLLAIYSPSTGKTIPNFGVRRTRIGRDTWWWNVNSMKTVRKENVAYWMPLKPIPEKQQNNP